MVETRTFLVGLGWGFAVDRLEGKADVSGGIIKVYSGEEKIGTYVLLGEDTEDPRKDLRALPTFLTMDDLEDAGWRPYEGTTIN